MAPADRRAAEGDDAGRRRCPHDGVAFGDHGEVAQRDRLTGDLDHAVDHEHRALGVLGWQGEPGAGLESHVGVEQGRLTGHRGRRPERRADEQAHGDATVADGRELGGTGVLERRLDLLGLVGQRHPRLQTGEHGRRRAGVVG